MRITSAYYIDGYYVYEFEYSKYLVKVLKLIGICRRSFSRNADRLFKIVKVLIIKV